MNDRRHQRRAANSVSGAITDDQRGPIYDTTAFDILVGTKEKKKKNEKSKKFRSTGIRTRDNRSTTSALTIAGSEYATVITGLMKTLGLYLIGEPSITELILEI